MRQLYILLILLLLVSINQYGQEKLVILHTNDTHSLIDPVPANGSKYQGMGGVVARKAIIDSIRNVEKNVLLLDAGDFLQGSPYFNLFGGRVEAGAMNIIGYDVGTIGNHEFDNGLDSLAMILHKLKYPVVCCNYDFKGTPVEKYIKPYVIINKNGIRIGVIGVGVDPEGLIQKSKYRGMQFEPIVEHVNYYAKKIKDQCDIVICLSHIGLSADLNLAENSRNVDVIIGGHSHSIMECPEIRKNNDNKDVYIYQVGKSGFFLGKIELMLSRKGL